MNRVSLTDSYQLSKESDLTSGEGLEICRIEGDKIVSVSEFIIREKFAVVGESFEENKSALVFAAVKEKLSSAQLINVGLVYRVVILDPFDDSNTEIADHDKNVVRLSLITILGNISESISEILKNLSLEELLEIIKSKGYGVEFYTPKY